MESGLDEKKISRITEFRTDPAFTEAERVALEFAEAMAVNHQSLDDEFFRRMRTHYSDAAIVELGMAAGQYIGFGRLLMVLDLERPVCEI